MPIYLLHFLNPTKAIIDKIKKFINKFFWGSDSSSKKIHWAKWNNHCGMLTEGGNGCKSLTDMT